LQKDGFKEGQKKICRGYWVYRKEWRRKGKSSTENSSQIADFFKSTGKREAAKTQKGKRGPLWPFQSLPPPLPLGAPT